MTDHTPADRDRDSTGTDRDPTFVTNQPALTTVRRRWWYLWGGLFALVSIGMLVWLASLQPLVAVIGIALVLVLYAGMLATGATMSDARARNRSFAWLMGAMAVVALIFVLVIMWIEWS